MNEDDFDLFRKAMKAEDVQRSPKSVDKLAPEHKPRRHIKKARKRQGEDRPAIVYQADGSAGFSIDETTDGPLVLFVRSGLDKAQLRLLKRGDVAIDESLDLHGLRSHEAERALAGFFQECLDYDYHCVQIIHGKGQNSEQVGGVLKPLTIYWLKQQREVVAFCSASPADGGSGATNVLLSH